MALDMSPMHSSGTPWFTRTLVWRVFVYIHARQVLRRSCQRGMNARQDDAARSRVHASSCFGQQGWQGTLTSLQRGTPESSSLVSGGDARRPCPLTFSCVG